MGQDTMSIIMTVEIEQIDGEQFCAFMIDNGLVFQLGQLFPVKKNDSDNIEKFVL